MNDVRLAKKWFNPLYFHLHKYISDPKIRTIMVYGGKSAAKTLSIMQLLAVKMYIENCSTICYRKEQTTIKTTLKPAAVKAIDTIKFDPVFTKMDFQMNCSKGGAMVFKGLDEEEKLKGLEGFKYLYFNELNQFTQEEWRDGNTNLRGMAGQKRIADWNPVDERSWIKTEIERHQWIDLPKILEENPYSQLSENAFVRISADGKNILIRCNYYDNKWVVGGEGYGYRDQNLIDEYELLAKIDPNWYRVNVLSEWGKATVKRPAAYNFVLDKHRANLSILDRDKADLIKTVPIRFIQDFNVDPMANIEAKMWRDKEGHHVRFRRENVLRNQGTPEMIAYLKTNYTPFDHSQALWTGDATARKRTVEQTIKGTEHLHSWKLIDNAFNLGKRLQVPRANPPVKSSLQLLNYILAIHPDVKFDENMKVTINEMLYTETDENGEIIKKNRTNEAERADFLDCIRYFFSTWMPDFIDNPKKYTG